MLAEAEGQGNIMTGVARIGTCLDGWTLVDVIGCGGTATVYRAVGPRGPGAVKVMHAHLSGDSGWSRRMTREARLLGSVSHAGLVRLLHVGSTADGVPFLVMELLEGQSLELLRRASGGALPVAEALRHVSAILDVLEHTHALGIVHRDLKPSNVFATADGRTRVLDFGIASAGGDSSTAAPATSVTRGILGTPAYMAPEQARGRWAEVDHRSDLWAVGATLFTLLTGELVHVAGTENERLGLAMARRARSVASILPSLNGALVEMVDRSLSYEPEARFQSAAAFRLAVERVAAGPWDVVARVRDGTPTVADPPRPGRLGPSGIIVSAGAALLLVASVADYWARSAPLPGVPAPADTKPEARAASPRNPAPRHASTAPPAGSFTPNAVAARPTPSVGGSLRATASTSVLAVSSPPPRAAPDEAPAATRAVRAESDGKPDDLDARTPAGAVAQSPDDLLERRD